MMKIKFSISLILPNLLNFGVILLMVVGIFGG